MKGLCRLAAGVRFAARRDDGPRVDGRNSLLFHVCVESQHSPPTRHPPVRRVHRPDQRQPQLAPLRTRIASPAMQNIGKSALRSVATNETPLGPALTLSLSVAEWRRTRSRSGHCRGAVPRPPPADSSSSATRVTRMCRPKFEMRPRTTRGGPVERSASPSRVSTLAWREYRADPSG